MPRVEAFAVDGLALRFFSHDHLPPHFQAEKSGRWEVRVRFMRHTSEMIEVLSKNAPRLSELKELKRLAERHRVALLHEWETKVAIKEPGADE